MLQKKSNYVILAMCKNNLYCKFAEVVKLADASDSKSDIRKDVWVQVPPSAPS